MLFPRKMPQFSSWPLPYTHACTLPLDSFDTTPQIVLHYPVHYKKYTCLFLWLLIQSYFNAKLSTHVRTPSAEAPDEKRSPVSQFPVPAASASSSPLSPRSELDEVQNGITVFPVKSFAVTNPSTDHAAICHQIGYSSVKYGLKKFHFFAFIISLNPSIENCTISYEVIT